MRAAWPPRIHVHKASGQDRVSYRGRHYYLGPSGSDAARKAYGELITRLANAVNEEPTPNRRTGLTVAELLARWDEYAATSLSPKEAQQYVYTLAPMLRLCGCLLASQFTAQRLEDVRDEMIEQGWTRGVINRRIVRVRTMWRWAERKGYAPPGSWAALRVLEPLSACDRRVKIRPPVKPCTFAELLAVCRKAPTTVRDMLLVQWWCGARSGEIRQMLAGEIDRAGPVWIYRPATHKNFWRGHAREIPLGPKCQSVLRRRLAGLAPGDPVFPSDDEGGCYSAETYSRAAARAARRAGVKGFHPYQARHAAKERVTREMGLDAARAYLGQKSIATTNQYAAGVDLRTATEAAKRLG